MKQRKRSRNAACFPVAIPGPNYNRTLGYRPAAERLVVNPDERKGSEKRGEALRAYADLVQREVA